MTLGAADTFRAAAEEQLEIWAERAGAAFVGGERGGDPAAVAYDAVGADTDVVIVDTAGRLHTQTNLMDELAKVRRVIAGRREGAPHEVLLVVDATTGQNGLQQARLFNEAVGVTGVALTKLDGSAKGGIAVAIAYELGPAGEARRRRRGARRPAAVRRDRLRACVGCRMNLVPSDQFSYAELAELFTRGYEGYFVPMHFDEPTLRYMVDTWDIDLAQSRVAPDAGLANLAIRGDRGWIGGIAVVPEQRRNGVGRALMEAVLELAPPTVLLEVIEANEPAIKLYESLGFEKTRVLEVWRVEAPLVVRRRPPPSRRSGRRACRGSARMRRCRPTTSASRSTAARCSSAAPRCSSSRHATRMRPPRCLSRGTALNYVNVPEGDIASGALERLGGELRLKQFEMVLAR